MAATTELRNEPLIVAPSANLQGMRIHWGGVWSGLLVTAGILLLLSVLGLAIGISTVDVGPTEDLNARGLATGAAIWSGVSLLIALFFGGMVATRGSMVFGRAAGFIEGMLLWVLTMFALIYMAASGVGMVTSGVMGALGGMAKGVSAVAVTSIDADELSSGDVDQITSRLTNASTVQLVAAATGLPQDQARARLSEIAQRVEAARADPARAVAAAREGLQQLAEQAAQRAQQAAAQAQPYATATLWSTLVAMLLALVAAIAGAMTGRRQVARKLDDTVDYRGSALKR